MCHFLKNHFQEVLFWGHSLGNLRILQKVFLGSFSWEMHLEYLFFRAQKMFKNFLSSHYHLNTKDLLSISIKL